MSDRSRLVDMALHHADTTYATGTPMVEIVQVLAEEVRRLRTYIEKLEAQGTRDPATGDPSCSACTVFGRAQCPRHKLARPARPAEPLPAPKPSDPAPIFLKPYRRQPCPEAMGDGPDF